MRMLTRLRYKIYRLLGVVSPSGRYPLPPSWASHVVADMNMGCDGDPFDRTPCQFACCPSTAGLEAEFPDAFKDGAR